MSRPSKLLLVGVAMAVLTVGVGWLGTSRTERELSTLQRSCEEALAAAGYPEADDFRPLNGPGLPDDAIPLPPTEVRQSWCNALPSMHYDFNLSPPVKTPDWPTGPAAAVAVRKDIIRTKRRLDAWQSIPFGLAAAGVAALCGLPWLWYFLLARIRELSAAIRGT